MVYGPISDSPSRLQRWVYALPTRKSSLILMVVALWPVLLSWVLAGRGELGRMLIVGVPVTVVAALIFHRIRDDRTWNLEQRLEQHMVYWPRVAVPVLRKRLYVAYAVAALAGAVFVAMQWIYRLADEGINVGGLMWLAIKMSSVAFLVAMIVKSVRARAWAAAPAEGALSPAGDVEGT